MVAIVTAVRRDRPPACARPAARCIRGRGDGTGGAREERGMSDLPPGCTRVQQRCLRSRGHGTRGRGARERRPSIFNTKDF